MVDEGRVKRQTSGWKKDVYRPKRLQPLLALFDLPISLCYVFKGSEYGKHWNTIFQEDSKDVRT